MVGLGYTQHQLEVDWDKLSAIVDERLNQKTKQQLEAKIDSSLMFSKVKYSDYSATVGYGYNWVFAKTGSSMPPFLLVLPTITLNQEIRKG